MLHSLPEMPLMVFPDCWVDKYPLEIIEKMELTAFYQKPVYVKNGIGYYNINGKAVPFRLTKEVKCSDITPKWVWDLTIVPSSVSKRYVV